MVRGDLLGYLLDLKSEINGITEEICQPELNLLNGDYDGSISESTDAFLNNLNSCLLDLQKKCIFLSLIFLDNPQPALQDISSSCDELKVSATTVCAIALKCPKSCGKTLLSSWNSYLRNIAQNLSSFVSSLHKSATEHDSNSVKTSIGRLCHDVDAFSKLPKSNKKAAIIAAQSGLALVEDALEELTAEDFPLRSSSAAPGDASGSNDIADLFDSLGMNTHTVDPVIEMDGDNAHSGATGGMSSLADEFVSLESILSDVELRQLIQNSIGLVKTVKACLKKACSVLDEPTGSSNTEPTMSNERMDEIIECCNKMSPTCDEFVLALYPPRRARLLESEATDLAAAMRKLLQAVTGETEGSSSSEHPTVSESINVQDKQIEILRKAIEHNSNKLLTFLNARTH